MEMEDFEKMIGKRVCKKMTLEKTGEIFFETEDFCIYRESGMELKRDERPEIWDSLMPNAVFSHWVNPEDLGRDWNTALQETVH